MSDEIKGNNYEEDVEENVNIVGIHRSKKLFVVLVVCAVLGIMYYMFFHESTPEETSEEPSKIEQQEVNKLLKEAEAPAQETSPRILAPLPKLPDLPPLVEPNFPDLPVITKVDKTPKEVVRETKEIIPPFIQEDEPIEIEEGPSSIPLPYQTISPDRATAPLMGGYDRERRSSPMLLFGGSGSGSEEEEGASAESGGPDSRFRASSTLEGTSSPSVKATRVGNPGYLILQGHIIDAVLETAIDSDVPSVLRAIVSRDVYAEAGDMVMIPKGSRLIGNCAFDSAENNTRVNVTWSRVILPNGVDVQINSAGVDELGRSGISGVVDNKLGTALTSTILLAGVSLSTAFATSKIPNINDKVIDETTKDASVSVKTSLPTKVISDAIKDFSDSMKALINRYSDTKPTVYVDQGTVMKVFVNQDIVFPRDAVMGNRR